MRLLDRYVVRQFVVTFLFSVGALSVIFVIVDLLQSLDDFIDHKAPFPIVVQFYLYFLPNILKLLIPVGMLLASLFSVGRLASANEITAMRAGGMPLYRFMLPLLAVGAVLSAVQIWFNGSVVPAANAEKFRIERQYMGRSNAGGSLYNLAFRESPTRNVLIGNYDPDRKTANTVAIETYSSDSTPRIIERIDAAVMTYDTVQHQWFIASGTKRRFTPDSVIATAIQKSPAQFSIRHEQIVSIQRNVEELTWTEMEDYLLTLKKGGKDTRRKEIDLAGERAFPWANVIVVMLAVPFASVRRRGGVAVHIAMAMISAFVYIAFTRVSLAFGANTSLPIEAVAWSANGLFFLIALVILVRTRT